jgi:predicted permease
MTVFFPALISVTLMVLLGAIAGRTLSLEVHTLSQLSVYILAPALVADGLYRNHLSLHSAFGLLAGFTLISLILYLVLWGLG